MIFTSVTIIIDEMDGTLCVCVCVCFVESDNDLKIGNDRRILVYVGYTNTNILMYIYIEYMQICNYVAPQLMSPVS